LINYFKSYSSLGDDRFFVSPCTCAPITQNSITAIPMHSHQFTVVHF